MISTIGAIAAGGALGAVARHGVNSATLHMFGAGFPWGTLLVNVVGSFLVGLVIAVFDHLWTPPQDVKALLVTGFLGAFTTFSTFSLDVISLWERGMVMEASGYAMGSVVLSIASIFLAFFLVRSVFA